MCHCGGIRWLKRMSHIGAEIHAEIGQIFHHNHIVFCGKFAYNFQLGIFKAYPCRVVGVGVNDSCDITVGQHALQLVAQRLASIVVDVKFNPLRTYHAQLRLLNRKTGVDKQHLVFARSALCASNKRAIRSCHATHCGNTRTSRDVNIEKRFDKS